MDWYLLLPTGLVLLWIGVHDFRERQISLLGLLVLLLLAIIQTRLALQWMDLFKRSILNSVFAGAILVSGTLLVKIKKPGDPVSSFIGIGDLLFLLAISPLFSFGSYLVFLNTSMILILVIYGIISMAGRMPAGSSIPLAGGMAMVLILVIILDRFSGLQLMQQKDWIQLLQP